MELDEWYHPLVCPIFKALLLNSALKYSIDKISPTARRETRKWGKTCNVFIWIGSTNRQKSTPLVLFTMRLRPSSAVSLRYDEDEWNPVTRLYPEHVRHNLQSPALPLFSSSNLVSCAHSTIVIDFSTSPETLWHNTQFRRHVSSRGRSSTASSLKCLLEFPWGFTPLGSRWLFFCRGKRE